MLTHEQAGVAGWGTGPLGCLPNEPHFGALISSSEENRARSVGTVVASSIRGAALPIRRLDDTIRPLWRVARADRLRICWRRRRRSICSLPAPAQDRSP